MTAKLMRLHTAGDTAVSEAVRAELMANLTHLYLTFIRTKPGAVNADAAVHTAAMLLAAELHASGELTEVVSSKLGRVVRINIPGHPQHREYLRYRGRGALSKSTVLSVKIFNDTFGTRAAVYNRDTRSLIAPSDTLTTGLQHNVQYLNGAVADRYHYQELLPSTAPGTRPLEYSGYQLPQVPDGFPVELACTAPLSVISAVDAHARVTEAAAIQRICSAIDAYMQAAIADWRALDAAHFSQRYAARLNSEAEALPDEADALDSRPEWNTHNTLRGAAVAAPVLDDLSWYSEHYVCPVASLRDNPIAPGFDLRLRTGLAGTDPLLPRGAQAVSIWELLTRQDDLVISAGTGSGKTDVIIESARRNRGVAVVVSMLSITCTQIAESMRKLMPGKAVARFGAGVPTDVRKHSLAALAVGKVDAIVLTWESLYPGSDIMLSLKASGRPVTFYIDEAHVAAPDADETYRPACRIGAEYIRDTHSKARKILLSATLGGARYPGLLERLGVYRPRVIGADLRRHNIVINVAQHTTDAGGAVLAAVNQIEGKRLVLCASKSQVLQVQAVLNAAGIFNTHLYYGTTAAGTVRGAGRQPAMTPRRKAAALHAFCTSEDDVMIATSAFGTGVDIPDIRGVILAYVPDSLIEVAQMLGRAGRDNMPAHAVCLYNTDALLHATGNQTSGLMWEFYHSATRHRWDVLADALAIPQ